MRTLRVLMVLTAVLFSISLNPFVERAQAQSLYAPVELQLAREALASARLALEVREYERARRLAEQALEDARVAEARADTESMRQTARDVRLSSEAVHDEATRLTVLY
jgi:hypothetical protein